MTTPPLATGQRRFYLSAKGAVMVWHRQQASAATDEDLACLSAFGRRVIEGGGTWDVSGRHWLANRVLARVTQ